MPFASAAGFGFTLLAGVFEAVYFAMLAREMSFSRLGTMYTVSRGSAVLQPAHVASATVPSPNGDNARAAAECGR